jgi:hypothetical protein
MELAQSSTQGEALTFCGASLTIFPVRRIAALILVLCYLCLGSGALEYWHNAQHAAEDARMAALASDAGAPLDHLPLHDDSNCAEHARLHLPLIFAGWVPVLVFLGLFIAFLTTLRPRLVAQRVIGRVDCRGPPVL